MIGDALHRTREFLGRADRHLPLVPGLAGNEAVRSTLFIRLPRSPITASLGASYHA